MCHHRAQKKTDVENIYKKYNCLDEKKKILSIYYKVNEWYCNVNDVHFNFFKCVNWRNYKIFRRNYQFAFHTINSFIKNHEYIRILSFINLHALLNIHTTASVAFKMLYLNVLNKSCTNNGKSKLRTDCVLEQEFPSSSVLGSNDSIDKNSEIYLNLLRMNITHKNDLYFFFFLIYINTYFLNI